MKANFGPTPLGGLAAGAAAAGRAGGAERFVHDALDGARAASALRTTAETAIDLAGGPRRSLAHGVAHVAVGNHVAGTDDHGRPAGPPFRWCWHDGYDKSSRRAKEKLV